MKSEPIQTSKDKNCTVWSEVYSRSVKEQFRYCWRKISKLKTVNRNFPNGQKIRKLQVVGQWQEATSHVFESLKEVKKWHWRIFTKNFKIFLKIINFIQTYTHPHTHTPAVNHDNAHHYQISFKKWMIKEKDIFTQRNKDINGRIFYLEITHWSSISIAIEYRSSKLSIWK